VKRVTPSFNNDSRNANPLGDVIRAFVALDPEWWCAERWGGQRDCENRNGSPHCPTCHLSAHAWCHECGLGLADLRYNSQAVTRVDRSYCSNACRQRAYRQRGKDA
jgi:hypothetical protein